MRPAAWFLAPSSDRPTVSVIIPVYNAEGWIEAAVQSVQEQSFKDWELILVDDGSVDASNHVALSQNYRSDARITVVHLDQNQGAAAARNHGMAVAQGRYVAFLDSDDLWHPHKLERQIAMMRAERAVLSCTGYVRQNMRSGEIAYVGVPKTTTRAALLSTNTIACSSAIFDRGHFGDQHMPLMRSRQDFAFWLDLMAEGAEALGVPEVLMTYRERDQSLSARKGKAARQTWHVYRRHLGMSRMRAAYYFSQYAIRGIARRRTPVLARSLGWLHPVTDETVPLS